MFLISFHGAPKVKCKAHRSRLYFKRCRCAGSALHENLYAPYLVVHGTCITPGLHTMLLRHAASMACPYLNAWLTLPGPCVQDACALAARPAAPQAQAAAAPLVSATLMALLCYPLRRPAALQGGEKEVTRLRGRLQRARAQRRTQRQLGRGHWRPQRAPLAAQLLWLMSWRCGCADRAGQAE